MKVIKIKGYISLLLFCYFSNTYAEQPAVQIFTENVQQGSMIVGRVLVEGDVYFNQHKLPLTETGEFVFGVGRSAPAQVELKIKSANKSYVHSIDVKKRQWNIERIDGLPAEKVNPRSQETLARISRDSKRIAKARKVTSGQNAFLMEFIPPAEGRISGYFGSQRILNGEPKRPHYGQDIANKVGTPITAPVDGIVTLAESDLFYSGGTIIIDHGFGIHTTYLHLSKVLVEVGDEIKQGQIIGQMGATGRATGSHLDWRLNWKNIRLDPSLLISE